MEDIIILGKGGHARSLVDILERENKYRITGYVVNNEEEEVDERYPVIGCDNDLEKIFQSGIVNAAVGVGYLGKSDLRESLWKRLKEIGFKLPTACDPSAIVANNAQIGEGCFIGKGAIINANASVGNLCIINTGAIIEHDCCVNEFSHISVGSVLCGNVKVGRAAFVGANATVIQGKTIGDRCTIGAGAVIRKDLENNSIFYNKDMIKFFEG